MTTAGLQLVLMVFAIAGFAGTGASLAAARTRFMKDGEWDAGMLGVAGMLFMFAALCITFGSGLAGVMAVGGVMLWVGYVVTAQRLGLFRIETDWPEAAHAEEPRQAR
jgi:hypothetical protein